MSLPRFRHDDNLVWNRKRIHIPVMDFSGIQGITTGTDASVDTGVAVVAQISTFGYVGLTMEDGDLVNHTMQLPYDYDPRHNMYVRGVWTSDSSTTTEYASWIMLYDFFAVGDTLKKGSTALDSAITTGDVAANRVTGAFALQVTPWGWIDGGTAEANDEYITWNFEMDTETATTNVYLLGIDIEYTPWKLDGPNGMNRPATRRKFLLHSAKEEA